MWMVRGSDDVERLQCLIVRVSSQSTEQELQQMHGELSGEERRRAEAMLLRRRREFIVGRSLVRSILGRMGNSNASDVPIETLDSGKPQLVDAGWSGLHFNVSHSRDEVAVAVSTTGAVGIDLQAPVDVDLDLVRRFFGDGSARTLSRYDRKRARIEFARLWSVREALAKFKASSLWRVHPELRVPVSRSGRWDDAVWHRIVSPRSDVALTIAHAAPLETPRRLVEAQWIAA